LTNPAPPAILSTDTLRKTSAQIFEDLVLERVEWRKVDVATLGLNDMIACASLEQLRDGPKSCTGPDDAGYALGWQRSFRPAQIVKILRPELGNRHERQRRSR
jgi:hypothetical protein